MINLLQVLCYDPYDPETVLFDKDDIFPTMKNMNIFWLPFLRPLLIYSCLSWGKYFLSVSL